MKLYEMVSSHGSHRVCTFVRSVAAEFLRNKPDRKVLVAELATTDITEELRAEIEVEHEESEE